MRIREATDGDRDAILAMGRAFYATTYYPTFAEYDRDSVSGLIDTLLAKGVLLVADDDGPLIGMVGLAFVPFIFNRAKTMACEVMWWVEPGCRELGVGMSLLRAIEAPCREAGAMAIQLLHLADSPAAAAHGYERLGFTLREHSYLKGL